MVRLTTAAGAFQARILAARLGAEGVLWELRGNVDGPFAFGPVEVLVHESDLEVARELLLADEVETAFRDDTEPVPLRARDRWLIVLVVVACVLFVLARIAHA